ncbi:MAG: tyrosine-type recombinase/integrase [Lachnospiraceae bacterium]|nr:tyrosine-type recombinase/integrase [Lachnospiraceae bacterium]
MRVKEPCEETKLDEFEHYLRKRNQSDHTIAAYLCGVRYFHSRYQDLTIENLKSYRSFLIKNYRPATINQRVCGMNSYLRFLESAHDDEYPLAKGYRLNSIKVPHESFQDSIISNEDCRLLETRLKEEGYEFWYFIVRFLVTTGARVSELTQIKVEHLACGYLDLYSKGGKMRRLYITDTLCNEAMDWCKRLHRTSGFLFITANGNLISVRGIQSRLRFFAERYGINPNTAYPHSFRHRFAINFLERCSDIALLADLMGHESIETTRIYLKKSKKEQQALLEEIVTW